MQLIDIKNDLAKIVYTPLSRELCLADFLIIGDANNNILAQIIHIETTKKQTANLALVKLLLSVDKNGIVSAYNGYIPSKDAQISYMEPEEIVQLLKLTNETMPWGYLASHQDAFVSLDVNLLKNKTYIQCDNAENASAIANNITAGLNKNSKKVVIIDFESTYTDINTTKYEISKDFKIPLNYDTLNYIYENDLDGMDLKSRAITQDILLDLQDYVRTSKDGFLPFKTFKQVVDNEYKQNPNAGIILLRNKLIKYGQQELFAQTKEDFNVISQLIQKDELIFFDVSNIRPSWQKIVLEFILSQINEECFLILNLTSTNSDKKIISKLYKGFENIYPIITTTYSYQEAQLLKGIAKNLILFTPIEAISDFACYNSFLSKLNCDEFIIWGKDTLGIPLILKLNLFGSMHISTSERIEISKCVDDIFKAPKVSATVVEQQQLQTEPLENVQPSPDNVVLPPTAEQAFVADSPVEIIEEQTEKIEIPDMADTIPAVQNILSDELTEISDDNKIEIIEDLPEKDDDNTGDSLYSDDVLELIDELPDLGAEDENTQESDTMISTQSDDKLPNIEITENSENIDYDEVLSDEDLDFIDELNEDAETVDIPVFEAESDSRETALGAENCHEGMFVYHKKYGKGVIEKIISYGNKTLCSIQFDNIGRRLLDPNLAELTSD